MTTDELNPEDILAQARDARLRQDEQMSISFLRSYLRRGHALLWLAKLTAEPQEALAAAELAFRLDPADEIAQRAIVVARQRVETIPQNMRSHSDVSAQVVLTTGMTLREARAVIWPFRGINQPIGSLLDAKRISLRDLAWAVEHAYGHVLTAARTILFTEVAGLEPAKLPQPLRVVPGSRYAERQERRSLAFGLLAAFVGLTICIALVIFGIASIWFQKPLLGWVALFVLVPPAIYLKDQIGRMAETALSYRMGRWGEERVVENLRALLDDRWTLFRNLTWPNHKGGDIDMILVGPGGVWAFEVKTYSGELRNVEDRWLRKGKRGWYKLFAHPGKQARRSAVRLKEFLAEQKIPITYVQPAVIYASSVSDDGEVAGTLTVERPVTPVWQVEELSERIEHIIQEEPILVQDTVHQIAELLTTAATEARRQEQQLTRSARQSQAQVRPR